MIQLKNGETPKVGGFPKHPGEGWVEKPMRDGLGGLRYKMRMGHADCSQVEIIGGL